MHGKPLDMVKKARRLFNRSRKRTRRRPDVPFTIASDSTRTSSRRLDLILRGNGARKLAPYRETIHNHGSCTKG